MLYSVLLTTTELQDEIFFSFSNELFLANILRMRAVGSYLGFLEGVMLGFLEGLKFGTCSEVSMFRRGAVSIYLLVVLY